MTAFTLHQTTSFTRYFNEENIYLNYLFALLLNAETCDQSLKHANHNTFVFNTRNNNHTSRDFEN